MPTLKHVVEELIARRKELAAAEKDGYDHVIRYERESVREIERAFDEMLAPRLERLIEVAGDLDLGPLPSGIGLYSSGNELPYAIAEDDGESPVPRP